MKQKWILFFVAFFMGYMVWPLTDRVKNGDSPISSADQEMRAKSARKQDAVAEYEALILSEEDKFQLQLDAANTLASLLALVEKWNEINLMAPDELVAKLAAKYPAEALRYYAAKPTDAGMNESMFRQILSEWAKIDWGAFSMFVSQDVVVKQREFVRFWGGLAELRMRDHPQDCVEQFRLFSSEKQRALMQSNFGSEPLGPLLAPCIRDPDLRARIEGNLRQAEAAQAIRAARVDEPKDKTPSLDQLERDRCEALAKQWKKDMPDAEELAEIMASINDRSRRLDLLHKVLEPRSEPKEDAQVWLKRISDSMAAVGEITSLPPSGSSGEEKSYQTALLEWLPKQSERLQRAWASELASRKDPDSALSWINGLATESLRLDVRHDVFERWKRFDPGEATAYIAEHGNEFERSMHLPEAAHAWALRDFEAAKTWLAAQPDSEAKRQAMQKIGVK